MKTAIGIRARRNIPAFSNLCALFASLLIFAAGGPAIAQDPSPDWQIGVQPPADRTTVIPRSAADPQAADPGSASEIKLVAQLTADGQHIDQGLVWRVFQAGEGGARSKLLNTLRDSSPTVKLPAGDYVVNAAFGRAHLSRKITVKPAAAPAVEQFVLNAGGLRLAALVGAQPAPANSVSYSIYSDRDQSNSRELILAAVKPGLVIRLNAGIYQIVSVYGDANASVTSDVTVEAGKLTETTVAHAAARTTFKLVNRPGGEAVPDTQWTIQTVSGETVKESVGALPTHILAPGTYTAIAKSQDKAFQREFTLTDGEITQIEVIIK
jgi:hypothetical protein